MAWLKQQVLYGWSWIRAARLLIGVFALVEAYRMHNNMLGMLAGIIFIQGLLGIGCCGTTCAPRRVAGKKDEKEEIQFEEIKGGQ